MLKKAVNFIKYNNLTVLILLGLFLAGSSVLAQTDTGQAVIGEKQVSYQGIDNTLLLQADLDNLDMDFKIEEITQDEKYYYVTYTFINLEPINNAWQYQLREKKRKISRKLKTDLGKYLAKQLKQEYDQRIKELKEAKKSSDIQGVTQVIEVQEYTGLIGKTLEIAGNIFPGYEPVKKIALPSPSLPSLLINNRENVGISTQVNIGASEDLTDVYNEYIGENDPDLDNIFGTADNCPLVANPDQLDGDSDGIGDVCDIDVIGGVNPEEIFNENTESDPEELIDSGVSEETSSESLIEAPDVLAGDGEPEVEVIELPVSDNVQDSVVN